VKAKTLKVKVVRLVTDIEGNLGDEDQDPTTNLDVLYSFSDTDETGGVGDLAPIVRSLSISST